MKNQYTFYHLKTLVLIISLGIFSLNLFAQKEPCLADFETEKQNLTVIFTNTSNIIPTDLVWDFGDGNYSFDTNPIHTYNEAGIYPTCLEIVNDTCYAESCAIIDIGNSNNGDCISLFEYDTTQNNFEIDYLNLSLGDLDSVIWDFGDNSSSKLMNPTHTFPSAGKYLTCLYIFAEECFDLYCDEITINPINDCEAFFEYDTTENNFEITYNNISLGDIDSVLWNFGDGTTSKLTNPSHIFSAEGEYLTCLTIFAKQCSDSYCQTVKIENTINCEANFSFLTDSDRPNIVHFTDESIGTNIALEWDFDDIDEGGSFSTDQNPSHIFPENSNYNVKLLVSNSNCSHEITKTIQINVPLSINFTFQLDSNNSIPNTFNFESEIAGIYDTSYWNFDKQEDINKETASYTYSEQNKEYEICLTAGYQFNDTSWLKEITCKKLTTSEYFDIGGQVYFGDSLLNNPTSTGDSALAYLYRIENNKTTFIDTNYYTNLGYYWFSQKLKAKYIIKTELLENAVHAKEYAPTYFGNTTSWEEAEAFDLQDDDYRKDIHLVKSKLLEKGQASIQGSVYEFIDNEELLDHAIIYLFDIDNKLIDFQHPKNNEYLFTNLNSGHYLLKSDITGIQTNTKLKYISINNQSKNINNQSQLFPNPAINYSILQYENLTNSHQIHLNIYSTEGHLIKQEDISMVSGTNYLKINLQELPQGMLFLHITDGISQQYIKLLHN